jgi:hypothetical protein
MAGRCNSRPARSPWLATSPHSPVGRRRVGHRRRHHLVRYAASRSSTTRSGSIATPGAARFRYSWPIDRRCARRWDDVGCVAGQKQSSVLHRGRDEAAHRRDALVQQGSFGERKSRIISESNVQLFPDPIVGPIGEVLVSSDLKVHPSHGRRAHAVQGKTVRVPGVDQLVGRRGSFGTDKYVRT